MRSPTVYDVAQEAGVSIATVSFAFRRPDQRATQRLEAAISVGDIGASGR